MLLLQGGRAEAVADGAAESHLRNRLVAQRDLAGRGVPEVGIVLVAAGDGEVPVFGQGLLEAEVARHVVPLPGAGGEVGEAGDALRSAPARLPGERARRIDVAAVDIGGRLAGPDGELVLAILGAGREQQRLGEPAGPDLMGHVEVVGPLLEAEQAEVEVARARRSQRGVEAGVLVVVHRVPAEAGAEVPAPIRKLATKAGRVLEVAVVQLQERAVAVRIDDDVVVRRIRVAVAEVGHAVAAGRRAERVELYPRGHRQGGVIAEGVELDRRRADQAGVAVRRRLPWVGPAVHREVELRGVVDLAQRPLLRAGFQAEVQVPAVAELEP